MMPTSKDTMSKVLTFTAIFILLSVTVMAPSQGVTQKGEMPKVAKGDHWEYTMLRKDTDETFNVTVNITSVDERIRDVPTDTVYDSYKSTEHIPSLNNTQHYYYEKDTFDIVVWHTHQDKILFFTPAWNKFDFPIEVGEEWESDPDVYNKTGSTVKMDYYYHYTCEDKVNIDVPAGNFDAYKINKTFRGEIKGNIQESPGGEQVVYNNATLYYSPEVKNMVKITYYNRLGDVSAHRSLKSYELHEVKWDDKSNNNDNDLPGLTLTTLLISTTAVTILEKRRRKD